MITCRNYSEARQRLSGYYEFRCGRCYWVGDIGWRFSSRIRPHAYCVYSYRETFPVAVAVFYGSVYQGMYNRTPDACFLNTDRYSHTTSRHQRIVSETMRLGSAVHCCSAEVIRSLDRAMQNFQTPRDSLFDIIEDHVGQIREEREKEIYERGMYKLRSKTNAVLHRTGRYGVFNTHRLTYA